MNYNKIERKYTEFGCEDYRLKSVEDLRNIIGLDIDDCKYFDELSEDNKNMVIDFLLKYLNGCGLEKRDGYKVSKAFICQQQNLVTEKDEDGYRTIVGNIVLNLNIKDLVRIENLNTPEDYLDIKDKLRWNISQCNGENTFLRVELKDSDNRDEWFHVYMKNNELNFY